MSLIQSNPIKPSQPTNETQNKEPSPKPAKIRKTEETVTSVNESPKFKNRLPKLTKIPFDKNDGPWQMFRCPYCKMEFTAESLMQTHKVNCFNEILHGEHKNMSLKERILSDHKKEMQDRDTMVPMKKRKLCSESILISRIQSKKPRTVESEDENIMNDLFIKPEDLLEIDKPKPVKNSIEEFKKVMRQKLIQFAKSKIPVQTIKVEDEEDKKLSETSTDLIKIEQKVKEEVKLEVDDENSVEILAEKPKETVEVIDLTKELPTLRHPSKRSECYKLMQDIGSFNVTISKKLTCNICQKTFRNKSYLEAHKMTHDHFECECCKRNFNEETAFKKHRCNRKREAGESFIFKEIFPKLRRLPSSEESLYEGVVIENCPKIE